MLENLSTLFTFIFSHHGVECLARAITCGSTSCGTSQKTENAAHYRTNRRSDPGNDRT